MGINDCEGQTGYTEILSRYVKNIKYEDIPPMVIERAKMFVLHTIGVSLCATSLSQGKDVIAMAREMSAGAENMGGWCQGKYGSSWPGGWMSGGYA